jgi:hypothetical protein
MVNLCLKSICLNEEDSATFILLKATKYKPEKIHVFLGAAAKVRLSVKYVLLAFLFFF